MNTKLNTSSSIPNHLGLKASSTNSSMFCESKLRRAGRYSTHRHKTGLIWHKTQNCTQVRQFRIDLDLPGLKKIIYHFVNFLRVARKQAIFGDTDMKWS